MRKRLLFVLQIVFFIGLGLLVVWFITKDFTPAQKQVLYDSFRNVDYTLLFPVTITLLLAHYVRAMRWRILIQPLNYYPGKANTFFAVMLGYMFNLFVPRLGEVLKCTLLSKYERVPPDKLVGTIVAERAFDVVSLLVVIVITLLIQVDIVWPFFVSMFAGRAGSSSFSWIKVLLVLLGVALIIILIVFLFKKYREKKFVKRIRTIFSNVYQGLMSFRHLQQKKAFLGYTLLMWLFYLLSIRIGFFAYEPVENLGTPPALSTLTFGSLGMIAPTQNGLGPYQFAVQKTMELYGVDAAEGQAFGWILWGSQTVILLAGGLICLTLLPIINRNKNEKTRTAAA
jgi:glycosyltransferase 2 family protein